MSVERDHLNLKYQSSNVSFVLFRGIYTGYSLSYALGNFITDANINGQGWRWSFIIAGIPGIVLGFIILLTVREPRRQKPGSSVDDNDESESTQQSYLSVKEKLRRVITFMRPSIILLWVASSIRNAAGYVWAYNTQVYFDGLGQTPAQIGSYMSWIPIVGGSIGVVFGGFISDRVVQRTGPHGRIWVLVLSQILSAPFAAGVLFLDPPYCYYSLLPNYIIGEMWVGVTLAVLVELVAPEVKVNEDYDLFPSTIHDVLFNRLQQWRPIFSSFRMLEGTCPY